MEANELKTGNYVTIKGNKEYLKVEDIIVSKNMVTLLSKDDNKIIECFNNIEPIELTEEIIKNAGYNTYHSTVIFQSEIDKYNKEGWPLPYNENPYDYYFDIGCGYGRIEFYYGIFSLHPDSSYPGSISFHYIHELQNILIHIYKVSLKHMIDNEIADKRLYTSSIKSWKKYSKEMFDKFDLWKQNK